MHVQGVFSTHLGYKPSAQKHQHPHRTVSGEPAPTPRAAAAADHNAGGGVPVLLETNIGGAPAPKTDTFNDNRILSIL